MDQTNSSVGGSSGTEVFVARPDRDLEDLIPSFLQNRKNEIAELEKAVASRDFDFVRRLAHTLKGICRPYGFVQLEEISLRLEKAGEAENEADIRALVAEFARYVLNVKVAYDS